LVLLEELDAFRRQRELDRAAVERGTMLVHDPELLEAPQAALHGGDRPDVEEEELLQGQRLALGLMEADLAYQVVVLYGPEKAEVLLLEGPQGAQPLENPHVSPVHRVLSFSPAVQGTVSPAADKAQSMVALIGNSERQVAYITALRSAVAALAARLRRVHRLVGALEELLGRVAGPGEGRDADARRDLEPVMVDRVRCRDLLDQLAGDRRRRRSIGMNEEHGELVAAQARGDVGAAHGFRKALGHGAKELVAVVVAEGVVHFLEAVEVDEKHRERLLLAPGELDLPGGELLEEHAVREAGEAVVVRAMLRVRDHARGAHERLPDFIGLAQSERRHHDFLLQPDARGGLGQRADGLRDAAAEIPHQAEAQREREHRRRRGEPDRLEQARDERAPRNADGDGPARRGRAAERGQDGDAFE